MCTMWDGPGDLRTLLFFVNKMTKHGRRSDIHESFTHYIFFGKSPAALVLSSDGAKPPPRMQIALIEQRWGDLVGHQ